MKITNYGDVKRVQSKPNESIAHRTDTTLNIGFDSVLKSAVSNRQEIKFSKHAQSRMIKRNIELTPAEMRKIDEALSRAGSKGIRDSLVLLDKVALIVNVASKTVVTTVDEKSIKESVFTNIDGAVIL